MNKNINREKGSGKVLFPLLLNMAAIKAFFFILLMLGLGGASDLYAQKNLSRKERKQQQKETLASRYFVEGQKFLLLEEHEKAYFYFEKAMEQNPNEPAIHFKLAEMLTRANKLDRALEYAETAVELNPSNKYYHLMIAEIYSKQKKSKEAAQVLQDLMENGENSQQYILELASLYLSSNELDKALAALDEAEDHYGVVEQLTAQKQRIYLKKNDLESAVKEGEQLIDAHPGNPQYVLALVEILFNNNQLDRAIRLVEENMESFPDQPELNLAAFTLYKEKKELKQAHEFLIKAFANPDLDPETKARTFSELSQEMRSAPNNELLITLAEYMKDQHPGNAAVQAALGDRAMMAGEKEKALDYFQSAAAITSADAQLLQNIVSLMFEVQKDFEEIEAYTILGVEEFPKKPEFWFFDGTAKLGQKKYEEARVSLEKSLALNEGKNQQVELLALGQLGDALHYLEEKDAAFQAYDKALEINPNNEHILNNYAYFLSLEKKDLNKAKKMSEKLVKKFPDNATYLDTHAWVLFQLGNYSEAKAYMEKALNHQEEPNGVMYEHYGDILYKLGDEKEALVYWKKAEGLEETSKFLSEKIKNKTYYE
jgi:tetratricopeptide (TPR) repeat protein